MKRPQGMDLTGIDFNLSVIAALVKKLGGKVTLTQDDFDAVGFETLLDTAVQRPTGWVLELEMKTKKRNG